MRCFSNLKVHLNHPESFKMLPVSKYIMSTKDTENFPSLYRNFWSEVKSSQVTQSCPTLCDPVDYSPPGSSVHGILQARILEWVAISFSRGSSWPKDRTQVSHIAGRCFNPWATRKAPEYIMWNARLDDAQTGIKIAWKKYQQPQICRWYHSNGRKWRRTKEALDEGERREWKNSFKIQHLKN